MFGQQRSQSGPSGLSINTGSANLFGSSSQTPASGGVLGSSKPLFGSSLNITAAAPSGGLFGASTTNQGGLFGAQPNQPATSQLQVPPPNPGAGSNFFTSLSQDQQRQSSGSFFGPSNMGQQQSTGGNAFGTSNQGQQPQGGGGLFGSIQQPAGSNAFGTSNQGQTQTTSNQQQQQGGSLFGNLNKPAPSGFHTQGFGQQPPSFTSQPSNMASQQQPQKSIFSTSIGQYTQQQQTIPGVRVDLSGLKSTTRFNDLYEEVQKIIENVDNFILGQMHFAGECELAMPKIASALEHIPGDVEFCSRKLDAFQQCLENDAGAIDASKTLVREDATDASLSFRAIQNLRMPQQFHHTGLWGVGPASQGVGLALQDQGEDGGSTDLVGYFTKQTEEMEKSLETFKKNIAEVETYLQGVEASTIQQLQRVQFTKGRDGGQRSADDQIRELAAVLREFENGILGVAGKVGGVREQVQETILGEEVNRNRRHGLY